jgi:hypothetical protein
MCPARDAYGVVWGDIIESETETYIISSQQTDQIKSKKIITGASRKMSGRSKESDDMRSRASEGPEAVLRQKLPE